METAKLKSLQKMGKKGSKQLVNTLVGLLVGLIMVVSFAPTIFENANFTGTGAPAWLITIVPILVAVGLFYAIYKLTM